MVGSQRAPAEGVRVRAFLRMPLGAVTSGERPAVGKPAKHLR